MPKDLLTLLSPAQIIQEAGRGYDRFRENRQTALFTIRQASGQYYSRTVATEYMQAPLALSFNAARTLVPNLVMTFPRHVVETPYLAARQFANDLGTALSYDDRRLKIDQLYRCVIVDALHSLGIIKTGIAAGGTIIEMEQEDGTSEGIDAGEIYSERVSFFNFVPDPNSREYLFSDARFLGDIIRIPRQHLLDDDDYDHDEVMNLPMPGNSGKKLKASQLTEKLPDVREEEVQEDIVEICELYIPSANAIVTVPGDFSSATKFLRVSDFYGLKNRSGPYTFLSLTLPVPDNPLPTPFFSVLLDLEMKANRMESKIMAQAERQKDITLVTPDAADDGGLVRDAGDGAIITCADPNNIQVRSFGGQQQLNEEHLTMLLNQYNMLAANVETLSGVNTAAKSATAANILQQNASIGLSDMQNAVYAMAAEEAKKRAWYIFNDPVLDRTIVRRQMNPGQMQMTPTGPQWVVPPTVQDIQVILTPEAKSGEFLDLVFSIEPESMARKDSKLRLQNETTFAQQLLPAVSAAAQIFQTLGVPFDTVAFLMRMARDMGIDWLDEVVYAPQIQQKSAMEYNKIQQATGQDVPGGAAQPNPGLNPAIQQNGQPGQVPGAQPTPQQGQNAGAQAGAQDAQRLIGSALRHSLNTPGPGRLATLPSQGGI
jgi:hypothetical protein